jgi:hypothetical protein
MLPLVKEHHSEFEAFSIATNESTDVRDTGQLAAFIHVCSSNVYVTE